ncbi:unnamed protein product [Trichogramma brassicae]|uniref:Uncharacterized protein n=1 Tax=Trichogramma brassicae TaxID=86971 RepID=A0A6H5J8B9_9HYME|nr:unnamed protein product [Trichogramma brassicae]
MFQVIARRERMSTSESHLTGLTRGFGSHNTKLPCHSIDPQIDLQSTLLSHKAESVLARGST